MPPGPHIIHLFVVGGTAGVTDTVTVQTPFSLRRVEGQQDAPAEWTLIQPLIHRVLQPAINAMEANHKNGEFNLQDIFNLCTTIWNKCRKLNHVSRRNYIVGGSAEVTKVLLIHV